MKKYIYILLISLLILTSTVYGQEDVGKQDKPHIELYIMAHCPFGAQMIRAITPVVELLDDNINFDIEFVQSIYGEDELEDQYYHYCINKKYPNKHFKYANCFIESKDRDDCIEELDLDYSDIESCVEEYDIDFTSNKYDIKGSPTLVINGIKTEHMNRNPYNLLQFICNSFKVPPDECDENLSSIEEKSGFSANINNPICSDSDSRFGKDIFIKGSVNYLGKNYNDYCVRNKNLELVEYYCENDFHKSKIIICDDGCENGACIEFLSTEEEIILPEEETESSIDCPTKSCKTISKDCYGVNEIVIEECKVYIQKDNECEEIRTSKTRINKNACEIEETEEIAICEGCQINKNTCIPFGTRIEKNNDEYYCSIEHKMLEQKNDGVNCQNTYECVSNNCKGGICTPICTGCLDAKNVCLPFGTRTDTKYCDVDYYFKSQKLEDIACNNNYECSTNICVNNQCISPSFIQKIIDWFKNIF